MNHQQLKLGTLVEIVRSVKSDKAKYVIYRMANKRYVAECFAPKGSRHAFFDTAEDARRYVDDFKKEMEAL
jgi:hypothetical protein